MARLLVVGVRPGSLGWRVAERAEQEGWEVDKVDHKPFDPSIVHLDVTYMPEMEAFWKEAPAYTAVVYSAGINREDSVRNADWRRSMADQMAVNFAGAIETLHRWLRKDVIGRGGHSFVTIASNSAYIPRSTGMSYCASKAAIVMAMRCAAREIAGRNPGMFPAIYTYSPGWLANTPMSQEVRERLVQKQQGLAPHRIPGNTMGVSPMALAQTIVRNLSVVDNRMLNGTDIRIDGGEV